MGVGMEAASQGAGNNKAELSGRIDIVQIIIFFPAPLEGNKGQARWGPRYMERTVRSGQVQAKSDGMVVGWYLRYVHTGCAFGTPAASGRAGEGAWIPLPKEQQASDGRRAPAAGLVRASPGCLAGLGREKGGGGTGRAGLADWRVVSLSRSLARRSPSFDVEGRVGGRGITSTYPWDPSACLQCA